MQPVNQDHCRKRLTEFLKSSLYYRPSVYLNRVQDTDLFEECAILYGRVCNMHDIHIQSLIPIAWVKYFVCLFVGKCLWFDAGTIMH